MNNIDDQAMGGCSHGQRSGANQKCDRMKQEWKVMRYIQAIVKRQHQQVSGQYGYFVPLRVLFQSWCRIHACLVNDATQTADNLFGNQFNIRRSQCDCGVGHDFDLWRAQTGFNGFGNEVVQYQVDELRNLTNGTPNLCLNRWIHFLLIDCEVDQLLQDLRYFLFFRIIAGLTEPEREGR